MTFLEYLDQKNIDADAFYNNDKAEYQNWEKEFADFHPDSFTMLKKFKINNIRRKYTKTSI